MAASHGKIGQLFAHAGRTAEARAMLMKGRAIVAPLAEKAPDVVLWQQYRDGFDRLLANLAT